MKLPPHTEASFRFLGQSASRARRRHYGATTTEHLDLVYEGWLAFQEAIAEGRRSLEQCYKFAENRMEQELIRESAARRPWSPDKRKGFRRMTPGEWRDLHAFLRRNLAHAPQQLRAMTLLYRGYTIPEVARELQITVQRAYCLRSLALRQLQAALVKGASVTTGPDGVSIGQRRYATSRVASPAQAEANHSGEQSNGREQSKC